MINKEEIKQLPNFLVVGVMKGGTSAAAVNLPVHPDIWMVSAHSKMEVTTTYRYDLDNTAGGLGGFHKEMDFWNYKDNFNKGLDFYSSFFNTKAKAIGESSPNYFHLEEKHHTGCLPRMMKNIPDVKIIILLRDPITRAFSHWNMIQQTKPVWAKDKLGKTFNECTEGKPKYNSLLNRSKYFTNLIKFKGVFKNVHVALQESIMLDPVTEYDKMFKFLGVRPLGEAINYNLEVHSYNYDTEIDSKSLNWLKKFFKNDVDNVKTLLPELDYSLWNEY